MIPESSGLFNLAGLENNWDGYGALAPKPEILKVGHDFFEKLREIFYDYQMPVVLPTKNGGVAFFWSKQSVPESELEITLEDCRQFSWDMTLPNGKEAEGVANTLERLVGVAGIWLMHQD